MIVLSKKRIGLVLGMVFISIFTFLFTTNKDKETVETVTLPVSGKIVVLDARTWSPR